MTKADIQLVRALADKRGRTEHGLFVAEGEKLIGELRTSHLGVRKIFALEGLFSGPEVEVVGTKEMERLSLLKTASNSRLGAGTLPGRCSAPSRGVWRPSWPARPWG